MFDIEPEVLKIIYSKSIALNKLKKFWILNTQI